MSALPIKNAAEPVSAIMPAAPTIDEILMIDPPPDRNIAGMAALVPCIAVFKFIWTTRSQSSSAISTTVPGLPPPTLLTSPVTLP